MNYNQLKMDSELLKLCLEKGILLDKDACEILSGLKEETVKDIVNKISCLNEKIITKSFFSKNVNTLKEISNNEFIERLRINFGLQIEISKELKRESNFDLKSEKTSNILEAKRIEEESNSAKIMQLKNVKVLYSAANQTKKIEVGDFVKYFKNRLNGLRNVLQDSAELENLVSINKIN